MYEIDLSGLWAYVETVITLVGGALRLDPAAFLAVFNYSGHPTWLAFWIAFIAGLSYMVGQSVILFANRVKPVRFFISLVAGAFIFVIDILVIVLVVWGLANLLGQQPWSFGQIARSLALASAPYWFSFLILAPYLGLILDRLLKVYVFLALVVAIEAVFNLSFIGAVVGAIGSIALTILISNFLSRFLTPFQTWIIDTIAGPEEIHRYPRNLRDVCPPQSDQGIGERHYGLVD